MANAAWFSGRSPSTIVPSWRTSSRSLTRMWPKCMPNGLTQKWSVSSGSRAVMWPATPSSNPNRLNSRNAAARFCLRCRRSSSIVRPSCGSSRRHVAAREPACLFDVVVGHGLRLRSESLSRRRLAVSACSLSVGFPLSGSSRSSPGCPSGFVASPHGRRCRWWRRWSGRRRRWRWRRRDVESGQFRGQSGGRVVSDSTTFRVGIGVALEAVARRAQHEGQRTAVPIAGLIRSALPAVDVALAFAHQFEIDQDRDRTARSR